MAIRINGLSVAPTSKGISVCAVVDDEARTEVEICINVEDYGAIAVRLYRNDWTATDEPVYAIKEYR